MKKRIHNVLKTNNKILKQKPMKTGMKIALLVVILLCTMTTRSTAQDSTRSASSGELKSVITGDVFYGFKYVDNKGIANKPNTATFTTLGYNPVVLYKLSNKLFFEGELEFQTSRWQEDPTLTSGNASPEGLIIELEYANLNYVINKHMLVKAGAFFTPYGVFEDWYHQRITNRMTSRPLGVGHGGIEPGSDEGVQLNGGFSLMRGMKLHYAVALLNGGKLVTDDPDNNNGSLEYESIIDNNTNKAMVARIGILPLPWLEFGGWYGKQTVGKDFLANNIGATHSGAYFSIIKDIDPIKGSICFRSEYVTLAVDDATFQETDTTNYIFANNNSSAYYAQFSYRPTMLKNKIANKCELAVRYGSMTLPDQAQGKWIMAGTASATKSKTQWAVSLDFWLKWNAVIKFAYEQNYPVAVNGVYPALPRASWVIQAAMGL